MGSAPELVYEFTEDDVTLVVPILEDAAAASDDFASIADKLRELSTDRGILISRELQWELDLLLAFELRQGDTATKITLEPVSTGELTWPRPMDQATEAVRKLWLGLNERVVHPLLVSLLGDVLLSSRVNPKPEMASRTIDGYIAVSQLGEIEPLHQTDGLLRGLALARGYGLAAKESEIRLRIWQVCKTGLANHGSPGATVPLAEVLAIGPRNGPFTAPDRTDVADLLEEAHGLYPANQFVIDSVADASRALSVDDPERTRASERQVQAYIDLAQKSDQGIVRMHHLNAAAQLAKRFGLVGLGNVAVKHMQAVKPEEMGWQRHEQTLSLPRYDIEKYLRRYRRARNWQDYLSVWLQGEAPTGSYATNLAAVKKAGARSTLASIVPLGLFGAHGLPQKRYATPDEKELRLLVQVEEGMAQFHGSVLAEALTRMVQRWPAPSTEEVAAYLGDTFKCDPQLGSALAMSFSLFWDSQFTAAGHLIYSKTEAAARGLLLLLDEPLYKVEMGKAIGQFPALDFYLTNLIAQGLDVDWVRAIKSVLLSEGSNLRNLTAHGFKHFFVADEAALLIRIAAMLIILTPENAEKTDREFLRRLLNRPAAKARTSLRPRLRIVWE